MVLVLGLKAEFCSLGLVITGLELAKNLRPKSWRIAKFAFNFRRLYIMNQDPHSFLTHRGHTWPFVTVQYKLHSQPEIATVIR